MTLIVQVAVFAPLRHLLSYTWPEALGQPQVGVRVRVPLGASLRLGVIQAVSDEQGADALKAVADRLDIQPLYDEGYQIWAQRLGRYYLAAPGQTWELALAWAQDDKRRFRCVQPEALEASDAALASVFRTRAALSWTTILQRLHGDYPAYRILRAHQRGFLEEVWRKAKVRGEGAMDEVRPPTLRATQRQAVADILAARKRFQSFLLFGVTGSGKTEVYLRAAEALVRQKKQVLILVPEIALTPMWVARLRQRFQHLMTWHSAMGAPEKMRVRSQLGDLDVLIGTRSALFLPLPRLGLIVVDEEHDSAFKQQDGVTYSARDMALLLAQEKKVPVVLGSATPSLECWRQVHTGSMKLLNMPERISGHAEMTPEIIDMRGQQGVLSEAFLKALEDNRQAGHQSIIFLNRRGYAPALQCTACGFVPECSACSMRLTLHRQAGELRCHGCGFVRRVRRVCEVCGEDALLPLGVGTEKVDELLREHVPDLRFARFDRDVVRSPEQLYAVLEKFSSGELDCLLGTQMLVKGHHFPSVTLVGVVNADLGMNLPDFRAGERWWQQMMQVMGRAGRGEHAGRVLVQTCNPDAPWLHRLSGQQARSILDEEMQLRKELSFPPFARWVRLVFSSRRRDKAEQAALHMAEGLRTWSEIQVCGPMQCAVEKVAGRFRVEVLLRDVSRRCLPWKLSAVLDAVRVPSGVRRLVDVDPQDMM